MNSDREILKLLGPVAEPFFGKFNSLTDIQRKSIIPTLSGKDILLASATASGKTEAIVAPLLARLRRNADKEFKANLGIIFLIVAPTRALVNDLFQRLVWPISEIGWDCGRQTSDHSDKMRLPHILITTPESFDSMLAHGIIRVKGIPTGHLLAKVKAVFLDEAHLYENSARGDHIAWLLARLKMLKKYAFHNSWISSDHVQVCAGSATVSNASSLANRIVGPCTEVIRASGDREMEIFTIGPPRSWITLQSASDLVSVQKSLQSATELNQEQLLEFVWEAIENASQDGLRKVLVFVPSRKLCDLLSAQLSSFLQARRNIYVCGHHGSLDRSRREEAETMFAKCRDAVLVATSTLEVGIDIGDVDIIVLVGAPPDTSSLLQRTGRGGRRSGRIKMVPIPRNQIDALAFSSMLLSACRGSLDPGPIGKRWSVFIQQTISLIMQSGNKGRKLEDLLNLVCEVWGESSTETARSVLDHLLKEELLFKFNNRLFLGEDFSNRVHQNRAYFHCNFEPDGPTVPVVDDLTRETIGHVRPDLIKLHRIAIGGRSIDVVHSGDEILVRTNKRQADVTFNYATRKPTVSRSFAEHVRIGLGFGDHETLLYESYKFGTLWFHFGGGLFEWLIKQVIGKHVLRSMIPGIALKGKAIEEDLRDLQFSRQEIIDAIQDMGPGEARSLGAGRFHQYLPKKVQVEVIASLVDIANFLEWAGSRQVRVISTGSDEWIKVARVFIPKDIKTI